MQLINYSFIPYQKYNTVYIYIHVYILNKKLQCAIIQDFLKMMNTLKRERMVCLFVLYTRWPFLPFFFYNFLLF